MFRDLDLYKKISISTKLGVVNFLTLLLWTRFGYLGAIFSFLKLETIQNHPQDPYTILQRAIHSLTWYYELLSKGPSLVFNIFLKIFNILHCFAGLVQFDVVTEEAVVALEAGSDALNHAAKLMATGAAALGDSTGEIYRLRQAWGNFNPDSSILQEAIHDLGEVWVHATVQARLHERRIARFVEGIWEIKWCDMCDSFIFHIIRDYFQILEEVSDGACPFLGCMLRGGHEPIFV